MNNLILKYLLLTFLLALLFGFNVSCQDNNHQNNKYDFTNIDKIIQSAITDNAFPGAVVLVSKEGKIIYEKAFGHLTYEDSSAVVTTNTIYDIASLTKVIVTSTAAMICYDRNLFDLDNPVSNYIPDFALNGKENVTIKNLLLHNSGLPSFKPFYKKYSSPDKVINDIYSTVLQYQPGTKTIYSDLGIITLAKVIEKVTGKGLDDFSQEEIFKPLVMNSTLFNPADSLKYKIAPTEYDDYWRNKLVWGEVHDETAFMLNGVAGHAGLFSTASDISHLLLMLLNEGNYNSKRIIKEKTIQLFTKRYSQQSTRALGWDTKSNTGSSAGDLFDSTSFGHLGFTGTSVWIDPTKDLFVVFLTNRVNPTRENIKLYKVRPALHNAIIKAIE